VLHEFFLRVKSFMKGKENILLAELINYGESQTDED